MSKSFVYNLTVVKSIENNSSKAFTNKKRGSRPYLLGIIFRAYWHLGHLDFGNVPYYYWLCKISVNSFWNLRHTQWRISINKKKSLLCNCRPNPQWLLCLRNSFQDQNAVRQLLYNTWCITLTRMTSSRLGQLNIFGCERKAARERMKSLLTYRTWNTLGSCCVGELSPSRPRPPPP